VRLGRSWKDNIKIDLKEIGYEAVNWIQLGQDTVQWRAVMNVVLNNLRPRG